VTLLNIWYTEIANNMDAYANISPVTSTETVYRTTFDDYEI